MTSITPRQFFRALGCSVLVCVFAASLLRAQTPSSESPAPRDAFVQSLALRTDRVVADSSRPALCWLTQTSPVAYSSGSALQLKVSLVPWEGEPNVIKELGTSTVYGGDLVANPFPIELNIRGAADGYYRYQVEVLEGGTRLVQLHRPVVLIAGLEEKQADTTARLARITGKSSTKASVLYPFDLARTLNLGKRVFGSPNNTPEFGLSADGTPSHYDFSAGLKRSSELLAALEAGRDPLWRVGGDTTRHHYLAEADEILPYRVYVPSTWDGRSTLPLVFVLHGNSRNEDFYFDRDGQIIPKTAEKHGFMLVAPLGYWPNGGYGYVPFSRERGERGVAGATAAGQEFGPAPAPSARGGRGGRGGGFRPAPGGVNGSTVHALVRSEWSEADTMRVFELVKNEYPIDPKRTFLFGYSAGGQGAHYLGPKFAEHWAAIAIGGSNAAMGPHYEVDRVKNTPMFLFSGSDDGVVNATRTLTQALQEKGVNAVFKEYPGINHDTAPGAATPDVFEFFARNGRK